MTRGWAVYRTRKMCSKNRSAHFGLRTCCLTCDGKASEQNKHYTNINSTCGRHIHTLLRYDEYSINGYCMLVVVNVNTTIRVKYKRNMHDIRMTIFLCILYSARIQNNTRSNDDFKHIMCSQGLHCTCTYYSIFFTLFCFKCLYDITLFLFTQSCKTLTKWPVHRTVRESDAQITCS